LVQGGSDFWGRLLCTNSFLHAMGADPVLNWLAKAGRELQVKLRELERQGASALEVGIGFQWNVHAPVFVPKTYLRLAQHLDPPEKPAKTEELVKPEEHPKEKAENVTEPAKSPPAESPSAVARGPGLTPLSRRRAFNEELTMTPPRSLRPRLPRALCPSTAALPTTKVPDYVSIAVTDDSAPLEEAQGTLVPEKLHVAVETALQDWQEVFASVSEVIFHGFLQSGWLEDELFYIARDVAEAAGGSLTEEAARRAEELATEITERVDLIRGKHIEAGRAEVALVLADLELQFNSLIRKTAASVAAGCAAARLAPGPWLLRFR